MSLNAKRYKVAEPYTRTRSHAYMVWLDLDTKGYVWAVWRIKPGPKTKVATNTRRQALSAAAARSEALQAIDTDRRA